MDVIEPEELSCLKDQFVNLDELKEDVKMKMNVCWRRKDTQIETDPCVIQDVIELPESVPFPVSWTVKMKKKQKETQDILSYHTQAAGCSDKARAKASGGRQPIEECGRTGL